MIDILNAVMIALLAFNYCYIGYGILFKDHSNSFTTWALWLILDLIALYGTYKKGEDLSLILMYCSGTLLVSIALLIKRKFTWGKTEIICALLTIVCIVIRFIGTPLQIIWISGIALFISGIPYLQQLKKVHTIFPYQKIQAFIFIIAIGFSLIATRLTGETPALPLVGVIYWMVGIYFIYRKRRKELYVSKYG